MVADTTSTTTTPAISSDSKAKTVKSISNKGLISMGGYKQRATSNGNGTAAPVSPSRTASVSSLPDECFPKSENDDSNSNLLVQCVLEDLEKLQDSGDRRKAAETWNSLGLIRLHTQRDIDAAIYCHEQALQYTEDDPIERALTLSDLGNCYEHIKQQERALESYVEALELLEKQVSDMHPRYQSIKRAMARLSRS